MKSKLLIVGLLGVLALLAAGCMQISSTGHEVLHMAVAITQHEATLEELAETYTESGIVSAEQLQVDAVLCTIAHYEGNPLLIEDADVLYAVERWVAGEPIQDYSISDQQMLAAIGAWVSQAPLLCGSEQCICTDWESGNCVGEQREWTRVCSPPRCDVEMKLQDDDSCLAEKKQNQSPVARWTYTIRLSESPRMHYYDVELNATSSFDPDGDIVEYKWLLAGDPSLYGEITTWRARRGDHSITLVVKDNDGSATSLKKTITISGVPTDELEACFSWLPISPTVEDVIHFDASCSEGEIWTYEWDFGNWDTATGERVSYRYEHSGTYTIALTIWDGPDGNKDIRERRIYIGKD